MDKTLGQRLKSFRKKTKTKMPVIAKETGISKDNLYKWEKGTRPSDINDYNKLKTYLDIMENVPIQQPARGASPGHLTLIPATVRLPLDPYDSAVVQTTGKAAAGTVVLEDDKPELIVDRIDAPFLGEVEGVVEVNGDSMEPNFKNGCRIAITRLKNSRILDWGECYYIVDKNWLGIVKRIYFESENSIKLISDHPDQVKYPPVIRKWDEIEAIFKVKAAIQKY